MAECILERSDMSVALQNADTAGYNRGYNAGKAAGGIPGFSPIATDVVKFETEEFTIKTYNNPTGYERTSVHGLGIPTGGYTQACACVCKVYDLKCHVISTTGFRYTIGYCYDDEYRYIQGQAHTFACEYAGQVVDIPDAVCSPPFGNYNMSIFLNADRSSGQTTMKFTGKIQWYLFEKITS